MADQSKTLNPSKRKPTQDELLALLDYDPASGILKSRPYGVGRSFRRGGKEVGWLRNDGYVHVQIRLGTFYAHCLIWCMMTGTWPRHQVDHRNLNRADNRWENLREATPSQNKANSAPRSSHKGIEILPSGKYRARVRCRGKDYHLGCFSHLEDAKAAYASQSKKLFGEYARA